MAPVTGATLAAIEPDVPDEIDAVALADLPAAPPPNVSDEPSALLRVIAPWMPPVMVPLTMASSDSATQMTL